MKMESPTGSVELSDEEDQGRNPRMGEQLAPGLEQAVSVPLTLSVSSE